jgi:ElaB/YqjD/DUF883 family membrane-anchored ribosome-binding protein
VSRSRQEDEKRELNQPIFRYNKLAADCSPTRTKVIARKVISNKQEDVKIMSEFEAEVKKAEKELEQGLVPAGQEPFGGSVTEDEFLGDLKMQAQEYGQKIQDAAVKAKDYASEKFAQAGDKFKEIQGKDPKELIEDAKEFARQKPGQTILISAAVGLVLGLLFRGGRR